MSHGTLKLFRIFVILVAITFSLNAKGLDFDLIKKGTQDNNTLLIFGGIQGDEPGGFVAASLIATHYNIKKGSVWVVPNLNFYSIIKRDRGPYGDMNRKFASIANSDPDYNTIQKVKKLINDNNVSLVLNLHDGSGFFREDNIDAIHNPGKWGQSSIIDQESVKVEKYGNLKEISHTVCEHINAHLLDSEHIYQTRNTRTREGDKEMEKSLTYYAINNGKAAFANEASKELGVSGRVYYHLLAIEKYMDLMGIEYERKFDFNIASLTDVIDNDIYISFYNDKIKLPLSQVRNYLGYFPTKKDGTLEFIPSNPLMTVIKDGSDFRIHYGNRLLVRLLPDYLDMVDTKDSFDIDLDGKKSDVKMGDIVTVNSDFNVHPKKGYRVNVIGYVHGSATDEAGFKIARNDILEKYSVDRNGQLFRVEFYKDDKFAGMVLVNFQKDGASSENERKLAKVKDTDLISSETKNF